MSFSFIKSPVRSKALHVLKQSPPRIALMSKATTYERSSPQKPSWDDLFSSSFDEARELKSHIEKDVLDEGKAPQGEVYWMPSFSSPFYSPRGKMGQQENKEHVVGEGVDGDASWKFDDELDSQDILRAHSTFVRESVVEETRQENVLELVDWEDLNDLKDHKRDKDSKDSKDFEESELHEVSQNMSQQMIGEDHQSNERNQSENQSENHEDSIIELSSLIPSTRTKRILSPQKLTFTPPKRTKPVENLGPIQQIRQFSSKPEKPDNYTIVLQTQQPQEPTKSKKFKPAKVVKPMVLSTEQEFIVSLVKQGISLFYTGSAGTGKSVLLRAIIKSLRSQYPKGDVAVTASTGLAACNIGGVTLHSFAGVGLGQGTVEALIKKVKKNRKAVNRWKEVKVLIIDEISMIDGNFFNALDGIARNLRRSSEPFGGIQIVVCGDFYQLPPVSKNTNIDGTDVKERVEAMFAFECESWKQTIQKTMVLKEVFRQKGDQTFIDMLNEMRSGYVSDANNHEFRRLSRPLENSGGIEPAQLYCTRYEVERANNHRLNLLKGNTYMYKAKDSGTLPMEQRQHVLSNFLTPEKSFLKVGAQVMCIKNFDETLVNGSLGQVIAFIDRDTYMNYKLMAEDPEKEPEEIEARFEALKRKERKDKKEDDEIVPHKLGTKSQDELNDSIFDFMSEIESEDEDLSDLSVAYKHNVTRKKEIIKQLYETSSQSRYPLVRFLLPDGNHRTLLVEPETWTIEDEFENVLAKRVQIPLILAWSLSIHKSQGQTLPRVKVDLRRVFENGQAYVALSRATCREGLQVLNFDRSKVKAHAKVNEFYSSLSSAAEIKRSVQTRLNFTREVVLE